MKRYLKLISILLGLIVLLVVAGAVILVTAVDPNRFKPLIIEEVKKYTGRQLIIAGDLSWSLFPALGVKVNKLALSNPPTFKQKTFAEINSATLSVKLFPLLYGQVESSGIVINGMKLYLIKQVDGRTNWQDLQQSTASKTKEKETPSSPSVAGTKSSLGLSILGIDVSNAAISWQDEQVKQFIDVDQFEFHAKNIKLNDTFPVSAALHFIGKNPAISGTATLSSHVSLDLAKQIYSLNKLDFSAKVQQGKKHFDMDLHGDVLANLQQQTLQLENLKMQLANLNMTGKMNVTNLSSRLHVTGQVQVQPFDVKKWLQATGQDVATLQQFKNLGGDFNFSAATTLSSVVLKGDIKTDDVQFSQIRLSKINAKTQMKNGVLEVAPLTADFYQGNLQSQAKVDLNTNMPKFDIQAKLANVQAQPLFADLAPHSKLKLSGTGNIDLKINTIGLNADDIVKNSNGTSRFSFNDGVIEGIDIGYLLNSASALVKGQSVSGSDTNKTPFGSLTATAVIKNGVISNDDLNLSGSLINAKGKGEIDLVKQQIHYQIQAAIKQASAEQKNNVLNLYGVTVPILIDGRLQDPSIRLDTKTLMQEQANQQLQKVQSKVTEQVGKKLLKSVPTEQATQFLNNLLGK